MAEVSVFRWYRNESTDDAKTTLSGRALKTLALDYQATQKKFTTTKSEKRVSNRKHHCLI